MPESLAATLDALGAWQLLAIWLVAVVASLMRAFTGFGFALTAVPAFSLMMAPTDAVVLSASLGLVVSLIALPSYWGKYPFRQLLPLLVGALLGTALGVLLLRGITPRQFQFWIGLAVILACAVLTLYRPVRYRSPGPGWVGATGLASGLLNGALATPGPPVIIYAMATEPPERSRALLMTFFLFSGLLALGSYGLAGFITVASPWLALLTFPAMYLGDKLGFYLFRRYGSGLYRRVALTVLFALGGSIMARALLG